MAEIPDNVYEDVYPRLQPNDQSNGPPELKVVSVRLVDDPPLLSREPVACGEDVVHLVGEELLKYDREAFCIICLNNRMRPVCMNIVSIGTLSNCFAHPREVFKPAILANAESIILMHNHPSGDPTPSAMDIGLTKRLCECGKIIEIPVLDHVIVASDGYFDFLGEGLMPDPDHAQGMGHIAAEETATYGTGVRKDDVLPPEKESMEIKQAAKRRCR